MSDNQWIKSLTPTRQGPLVLLVTLLGTSLLVTLLVFEVRWRVQIVELGYQMTDLTQERERLLNERKKLEIEAAVSSRTERLETVARDGLGLRPIKAQQIVHGKSTVHADNR